MNKHIWLIGGSQMAVDYAKVLTDLNILFDVIGRGETSASAFKEKTGIDVHTGGIDHFLSQEPVCPSYAIVVTGVEQLSHVTTLLLNYGVKHILVEKPGGLTVEEIKHNAQLAKVKKAQVYIAYNRRFYSSVIKAQELIKEDGGVLSFHFEFTEWSHIIENVQKNSEIKAAWLLSNSTHVIDTAFFLGGFPKAMSSYSMGELSWHKPAVFTGAGKSDINALFSYCANWQSPGRWGVEIMTRKHRIYLKPMEVVQIQLIGSIQVNPLEVDDCLDKEFKPGLYLQTKAFIEGDCSRFCTIEEQGKNIENYYSKISNSEK